MKVIAGVDGSKYGRWATEWIAQLPFASSPQVTALHVVDVVSLRAPFVVQPVVIWNEHFIQTEIKRLETWRKKVAAETKTLLFTTLERTSGIEDGIAKTVVIDQRKGAKSTLPLYRLMI